MEIDLLGVPIDFGAGRRGVDMGPSAIRYAGLAEQLQKLGLTVHDHGNFQVPILETCQISEPALKYLDCIVPVCRQVMGATARSIDRGRIPLTLGGDHSLALGSIRGAARKQPLGVLWIDAHADFNTANTTPSGNIHGMPLAALCGLGDPRLVGLELNHENASPGVLDPQNVVIIGVRDIDPGEKQALQEKQVQVYTMHDIDRRGMAKVMQEAIARAAQGTDGIYLSFDLDVLDPLIAPGVGTPVSGGLNYREAHLACELIAESGLLRAMDLVEVNPILDIHNQTAAMAVELALSVFGKRIL